MSDLDADSNPRVFTQRMNDRVVGEKKTDPEPLPGMTKDEGERATGRAPVDGTHVTPIDVDRLPGDGTASGKKKPGTGRLKRKQKRDPSSIAHTKKVTTQLHSNAAESAERGAREQVPEKKVALPMASGSLPILLDDIQNPKSKAGATNTSPTGTAKKPKKGSSEKPLTGAVKKPKAGAAKKSLGPAHIVTKKPENPDHVVLPNHPPIPTMANKSDSGDTEKAAISMADKATAPITRKTLKGGVRKSGASELSKSKTAENIRVVVREITIIQRTAQKSQKELAVGKAELEASQIRFNKAKAMISAAEADLATSLMRMAAWKERGLKMLGETEEEVMTKFEEAQNDHKTL